MSLFDSAEDLQLILAEMQEENLRLRGALNENLSKMLTLREQLPENDDLHHCITEARIALAE